MGTLLYLQIITWKDTAISNLNKANTNLLRDEILISH